MENIIKIIDNETAKQIASHINKGEFSWSELNSALIDSIEGVTEKDAEKISLFFKREKKVDEVQSFLDF